MYRGQIDKTVSGKTCQAWTAQEPHEHTKTPKNWPEAGLGEHNYCRNPDGMDYTWCYTTDPNTRWEECDISDDDLVVDDLVIDDLVVFLYSINEASYTSKATGWFRTFDEDAFRPRIGKLWVNANASRPWFFDQTPETVNDIPNQTHYDFLTTALHELGHILGFLRNRGLPFTDLVENDGFAGLKAKEFNNGAPIPLAPGSSHIAADYSGGLIRPNLLNQMMASFDQIQGYRTYPSRLDASILEDLGYKISETPSKYHPLNLSLGNATYSSPYQDLHSSSRQAPSYWTVDGTDPKGLWFFDNSEQLNSAIIGTPVLYAPPETGLINEIAFEEGVKVPTGGFLYTEHGLTDGNCGGEGVNCYSIVFDIRLPKLGVWYSLLNTSSHNTNDGDLWISPEGSLGQWTYSPPVIDANEWVSLVYTVDLSKGEQSFYANGDLVHFQTSETYDWMDLDGRHALGIMPDEYPFFTLFADDDGEDAEVEVRRVAFYDFPLNAKQVKDLSQSVLEHCCVVRESDTSIKGTERIAGPENFDLYPVYPNPFNSTVMVPLSVPQAVADVELGVYNVLGQRVRVLYQGSLSPGWYQYIWDGRDKRGGSVVSGVYIFQLKGNGIKMVQSAVFLR